MHACMYEWLCIQPYPVPVPLLCQLPARLQAAANGLLKGLKPKKAKAKAKAKDADKEDAQEDEPAPSEVK